MKTRFLTNKYLLLQLINYKTRFLGENYVTISELNRFNNYLQNEFNNKNLNVVISNELNNEDFLIYNGIIESKNSINLDFLPTDILNIISDNNLITNFLIELEKEKIVKLEEVKTLSKQYKL